jgi:hypothetical protein
VFFGVIIMKNKDSISKKEVFTWRDVDIFRGTAEGEFVEDIFRLRTFEQPTLRTRSELTRMIDHSALSNAGFYPRRSMSISYSQYRMSLRFLTVTYYVLPPFSPHLTTSSHHLFSPPLLTTSSHRRTSLHRISPPVQPFISILWQL